MSTPAPHPSDPAGAPPLPHPDPAVSYAQMGTDGPEPPAYLIQAGNETRGRTGEAEALLDGGEAALEVGAVQELAELQEAMAEHEHLGETPRSIRPWTVSPGHPPGPAILFPGCFLTRYLGTLTLSGGREGEMPSLYQWDSLSACQPFLSFLPF